MARDFLYDNAFASRNEKQIQENKYKLKYKNTLYNSASFLNELSELIQINNHGKIPPQGIQKIVNFFSFNGGYIDQEKKPISNLLKELKKENPISVMNENEQRIFLEILQSCRSLYVGHEQLNDLLWKIEISFKNQDVELSETSCKNLLNNNDISAENGEIFKIGA